ncbi:DUF1501 domain-containing protein [bacterium]|nr:DUF1501 domain-containing protein [bacterium]
MINNRREFLTLAGYTILFSAFPTLAQTRINKRILILVELQGANDGLNTVIPLNQDYYYRLRPTIGIEKNRILNITKENGLHYSLKNIAKNYENGNVKIIQNLGYPHAVLSHFRSIDIWETGGDGKKQYRNGWLVDTLNKYNRNLDLDAKAMFLDNSNSIFRGGLDGFIGPNAVGLQPEEIEVRDTVVPVDDRKNFGLLNEILNKRKENSDLLKHLVSKFSKVKNRYSFGGGQLGSQLSTVCNLIASNVNIPVYKVALGSFDTHNNQQNTHRRLLRDLDVSLSSTINALKEIGLWNNTLIMTYSEFGRRANENGSRGTDHGMAAPHFVLGGNIKGGIIGEYNDLSKLWNNNINFKIDYRSLYEFVLRNHFNITNNPFVKFKNNLLI